MRCKASLRCRPSHPRFMCNGRLGRSGARSLPGLVDGSCCWHRAGDRKSPAFRLGAAPGVMRGELGHTPARFRRPAGHVSVRDDQQGAQARHGGSLPTYRRFAARRRQLAEPVERTRLAGQMEEADSWFVEHRWSRVQSSRRTRDDGRRRHSG